MKCPACTDNSVMQAKYRRMKRDLAYAHGVLKSAIMIIESEGLREEELDTLKYVRDRLSGM